MSEVSIKEMKVGDFIKISGGEKAGKWSHIGEVTVVGDSEFTMATFVGTMTLRKEPDTKFTREEGPPTGWKKFRDDPEKFLEREQTKQKDREERIRAESKPLRERVFDIVKENSTLKLDKLIKLCVEQTGGDPALVQTQVQLAKIRITRGS